MVEKKSNQNTDQKSFKGSSKSEKGDLFIKKEAFRNMLTHVLRFGSDKLEQSIEVMGICIGKYDNIEEKVIVENAVPLIHGDKAEIGFDKDAYDLFTEIGKKYSSTLIGYYHSHPSWGLYLSESDVVNLQYFQKEEFPYGFSIVFDHALMGKDGNLGFEIYRLDDYTKVDKYHTVPFKIEIPNSLEYFKWVQKFSEDFQKKDPILIKEINEFAEQPLGELQEIPKTEETQKVQEEIVENPELTSIVLGFQQGTEKLSEMFINITKTQIGDWIKDVNLGTSKGTEYISKSINKMKEAISSGINKVANWFNMTLNETGTEFKKSVSNYINARIENNKEFITEISTTKNILIDSLNNLIEDYISNIKNEMELVGSSISGKVEESMQINSQIEKLIKKLQSELIITNNQVNSLAQNTEKKFENSNTSFQTNLEDKIEKMNTELEPFKEFNSEIKVLIEKLQKTITTFRNLGER